MLMVSIMFIVLHFFFFSFVVSAAHPISLSAVLIAMSLVGGVFLMKIKISWFFYILVLVFLGGVMVVIIYMSTLAANEKFSFSISPVSSVTSAGLMLSGLVVLKFKHLTEHTTAGLVASGSLYESGLMSGLIFLMVYLLLALVAVVKLVKFESGPLVARL
uniref:NADH dehydrogenase subunit 6 n=1 Tax=Calanus sinicus TaxID=114070 RepID=G9BM90_CALSV|nr:NADH dehydrogenase subunit 6 [Calanus sinicus]ADT63604.1 NADH dehydrogenase subunit 6 [Calanus sinicus]ADT63617.1 NADH dehydrogenase subunit 6 [Calanus sinicus]ADT63630.1 NADH dehydrogenase subunit 6 [Calanus sinicus]ADT63643.1 NADH dehydrogenase subunit 6 [Calanus sinicus]